MLWVRGHSSYVSVPAYLNCGFQPKTARGNRTWGLGTFPLMVRNVLFVQCEPMGPPPEQTKRTENKGQTFAIASPSFERGLGYVLHSLSRLRTSPTVTMLFQYQEEGFRGQKKEDITSSSRRRSKQDKPHHTSPPLPPPILTTPGSSLTWPVNPLSILSQAKCQLGKLPRKERLRPLSGDK